MPRWRTHQSWSHSFLHAPWVPRLSSRESELSTLVLLGVLRPISRLVVEHRDLRAASRPWMTLVLLLRLPSGGEPDGCARWTNPLGGSAGAKVDPKTNRVLPECRRGSSDQVPRSKGLKLVFDQRPSSGGFEDARCWSPRLSRATWSASGTGYRIALELNPLVVRRVMV